MGEERGELVRRAVWEDEKGVGIGWKERGEES